MFGLLSAGVSLAGLGMSAIQAIKANKDMKTYQKQADAALNQYASITRPNAYAGLKAADVSSLDYQQNQQLMSQGVDTLGGLGAEGAAGVAGLFEAGRQANLQAAQAQGQANYQRDAMVAQEQSDIFAEQAKAQREVAGYRAGAAISGQQQAADARSSAIEGMFGSALGAIDFAKQDFDPSSGQYLGRGHNDKGSMTKEQSEGLNLLLGLINKPV